MASETRADIVADFRQYVANTKIPPEVAETIVCYLDRIEAAWKREKSQSWHHREMEELILRHEKEIAELKKQTGNAAAMREALKGIRNDVLMALHAVCVGNDNSHQLGDIMDKCKAALAKPPRNCDVGTPDEQTARYYKFCSFQGNENCNDCSLKSSCVKCEMAWAQMPYAEEGGAK